MMNDQEERLQAALEQLESGASLADLTPSLAPEELDLLRLAASLRTMDVPHQDATQLHSRRAALISLAEQETIAPTNQPSSTWPNFRHWLRAQAGWVVVGAAVAVLLVVLFAGRPRPETADSPGNSVTISDAPESQDAERQIIQSDAAAPDEVVTPSAAAVDAPSAEARGNAVFLPAVNHQLALRPGDVELRVVNGFVEIWTPDGGWTAASQVTRLSSGQRVRTGSLSSARLAFHDGSQAVLGPNSEIGLETINAQLPADGFRTIVLFQAAGISEHQVQFRNDAGSRYEVKTATGSGVARGTKFRVTVGEGGAADYTVTEGRVDVSNLNRTVQVVAGQTTDFAADQPPSDPTFVVTGSGVVSEIGPVWIIAGQPFAVDEDTRIVGNPQVGDLVSVEARLQEDGPPLADLITLLRPSPANRFALTGVVESIGPNAWIIAGQTIAVTADTDIATGIVVGDRVRAEGVILANGGLQAGKIALADDAETHPFEFTGVVQALSADIWTISGVAIRVNADTDIDGGIVVGDLVRVEGHILSNGAWLADEIELVEPGGATFDITGVVQSIAPWRVAGVSFDVLPWTVIDPGIVVGDLVRVTGRIQANGAWLAHEIEKLDDDDAELTITFVGVVNAIDPWIVSGLPLVTDAATIVDPAIVVGDLVRVTARIRADDTWLATRIEKLDVTIDPGCVLLTAVITGINGDQVVLSDGRTIVLGPDIVVEGALQVGSVVLIVACANPDGTITIVSITVIYSPAPAPQPGPTRPSPEPTPPPPDDEARVTICHKPGTPAEQTKTVPPSALGGHLGHGDTMGPCR